MAYRKSTNKKVDKAIFHETGSTTKAINLNPRPMRGGIRL